MSERVEVTVTVNGREYRRSVEPRLHLADFLRHELGLTGTHVGCEQGVCGNCTVLIGDEAVKSCLYFAVQADGLKVTTVEALARADGLSPLQQAFKDEHALQCGFCTPGFLMTAAALARAGGSPTRDEIRVELAGVLCRCTGYEPIVNAVQRYLSSNRDGSDG